MNKEKLIDSGIMIGTIPVIIGITVVVIMLIGVFIDSLRLELGLPICS